MGENQRRTTRRVQVVRSYAGVGEVLQVLVDDVAVWTWASHADGELDGEALVLFEALERWLRPERQHGLSPGHPRR